MGETQNVWEKSHLGINFELNRKGKKILSTEFGVMLVTMIKDKEKSE